MEPRLGAHDDAGRPEEAARASILNRPSRQRTGGRTAPWRAAAAAAALLLASPPASARTCTRELSEKEFAGTDIVEMICGNVAVRLLSLRSEMYYRRWAGEIAVRAIKDGGLAKVALAAFDAPGDLIGTATLFDRKIGEKPKTITFRMEGMFVSITDTKKILMSISMPDRQSP